MNNDKFFDKVKNFVFLKTLQSKIVVTFVAFSISILFFMSLTVTSTITKLEEDLIANRLVSDINYIEDLISGHSTNAHWNIKNDAIYFGDVLIGDGTEETANLAPFLDHERKTGTFAYVFMLDEDAQPGYVPETETSEGYHEGHYLRVAGSTKSPEGKSIVGTYITKNVSDSLDSHGFYSGEANVAGGSIFCLYNVLLDENGNTIGAMVVGRNITELKDQISASVSTISTLMMLIVLICCLIIIVMVSKWVSSIGIITRYLRSLSDGIIPEKPLALETMDEMSLISESINVMVESIQENIVLKKKSETDALTGLPNRFAYDYHAKFLHSSLLRHPETLAVEVLDIDYFKEYNDNYGHQAGDECIQKIANEIHNLCLENENVFCCRYGGDEFILMYNGYSREEIEGFLEHLRQSIERANIEHIYSKSSDIVTITQGVCFGYFDHSHTIQEYFSKADQALYEVKKESRGRYMIMDI